MGDKTSIGWTDATWNPIRARLTAKGVAWLREHKDRDVAEGKVGHFCIHMSEGCRNCYAERQNVWTGTGLEYLPFHLQAGHIELYLDGDALTQPLRWDKPRMIFVCSMTDVFADFVPREWIDRMFAVMALTHRHTFQVLTKRPERMREYLGGASPTAASPRASGAAPLLGERGTVHERIVREAVHIWSEFKGRCPPLPDWLPEPRSSDPRCGLPWPLPNVIGMVSVEDQATADARIPVLLDTPLAVRGISLEPMLGPVDLRRMVIGGPKPHDIEQLDALTGESVWHASGCPANDGHGLDWVIVGGESGSDRAFDPEWARSILNQCKVAGVPVFIKQMGALWAKANGLKGKAEDPAEWPEDLRVQQFPTARAA